MLMIRNLTYSLSIKVAIGGGVAICTPKHAHALKIKSLEIQPFCFDVIMTLLLRRVSDGQLVLRLKCSEKYANIMAADILTPRRQTINSHIIGNYANPVYGVATICHQVRWLRWGHPSLFHTATSLLIWYKMFCVRDISYRLIWMEFINMFSVYAQSGTNSRFNW